MYSPTAEFLCSVNMSNSCVQFLDEHHDQEGILLLLKGKICSQTFTLANIYLPNPNSLPTLEAFLSTHDPFLEGTLVLGGDFNLTLDPHRDSSSNLSSLLRGTRLHLKDLLHTLQLVYIWKIYFIRRSGTIPNVHGSYSRIYFF